MFDNGQDGMKKNRTASFILRINPFKLSVLFIPSCPSSNILLILSENIIMNFYKNKTALVTGASSGIGAQFARALARKGCDLILVARREDKLRELADELSARHQIKAHVIARDLSEEWAARALHDEINRRELRVDILINNAGFASQGDFETLSAERLHREVMLNVTNTVDLARAFLPAMIERKSGVIVNVASTAGFVPLPTQAVYGGTKAFVLSWSEALWAENRERGVKVLALCPGATKTEFFERVGRDVAAPKDTPEFVVRCAFKALRRGDSTVVAGRMNALVANVLPRILTRRALVLSAGRVIRKFWASGKDVTKN